MDLLKPEYNIHPKAGGGKFESKRTAAFCAKLSKIHTGRRHSIATRLKMIESRKKIQTYAEIRSESIRIAQEKMTKLKIIRPKKPEIIKPHKIKIPKPARIKALIKITRKEQKEIHLQKLNLMNQNQKPRVIIYTRVSTEAINGVGQTIEPQLLELTEYCARQGWNNITEISDTMSGTKASRPGMDAVVDAARKKQVDILLVVKLDRLGRSLTNVIKLIEKLSKDGCAIICTSQGIDTRKDSPCGQLMINMIASFAQFERSLIVERTIAGLANARANGVKLGRPSKKLIAEWKPVVSQWKAGDRVGGLRGLARLLGGVSVYKAKQLSEAVIEAEVVAGLED